MSKNEEIYAQFGSQLIRAIVEVLEEELKIPLEDKIKAKLDLFGEDLFEFQKILEIGG